MEKEIWKDIKGFEGTYQVSNFGNIKSLRRTVKRSSQTGDYLQKEVILKPATNAKGYYHVALRKDGDSKTFRIHRLVAESFISNPTGHPQVNHKDGNKTNNHVNNLEWTDNSGNLKHAYKLGLRTSLGVNNGNCKLNPEFVKQIRSLYATKKYEQKDLAKMFNCTSGAISAIVIKRTWKHI